MKYVKEFAKFTVAIVIALCVVVGMQHKAHAQFGPGDIDSILDQIGNNPGGGLGGGGGGGSNPGGGLGGGNPGGGSSISDIFNQNVGGGGLFKDGGGLFKDGSGLFKDGSGLFKSSDLGGNNPGGGLGGGGGGSGDTSGGGGSSGSSSGDSGGSSTGPGGDDPSSDGKAADGAPSRKDILLSSNPTSCKLTPEMEQEKITQEELNKVCNPDRDKIRNCGDPQNCLKQNPLVIKIGQLLDFLSALVGVIVVGSIILGGIQYSASRGDPNATAKAIKRITNALIAFVAFLFLYVFVQWVIPGGIF